MKKYIVVSILLFITCINSHAQFGLYASAAYINTNGSNSFYNNTAPGLGQDIGTASFQNTDLGIFEQNSGNLKFTGAEVKTFKGGLDNVCSAKLYFTVYLTGSRPASPVFTAIDLGFYSDCFAPACGTFFGSFDILAGGGCCSAGDQKWQSPGNGSAANIDLTTYVPGIYTLEVYYEITGQDGGGGCTTTKYDNNNNNPTNYTAAFTITTAIPVSFGNISVTNNISYNNIFWNTYSEAETKAFKIERSADGINFYPIGEINAAGSSSTIRAYSFVDMHPVKGINYYRIKMIETSGRYQNSGIVKTSNKTEHDWYIINDPQNNSIKINRIEKGDEINIFEATGIKVFSGRSDGNYLNINVSNMSTGIYFVNIISKGDSEVKQIFINH